MGLKLRYIETLKILQDIFMNNLSALFCPSNINLTEGFLGAIVVDDHTGQIYRLGENERKLLKAIIEEDESKIKVNEENLGVLDIFLKIKILLPLGSNILKASFEKNIEEVIANYQLENCIIENYDLRSSRIFFELEELNCQHLELFFEHELSDTLLDLILMKLPRTIHSLKLVAPYTESLYLFLKSSLIYEHKVLLELVLYGHSHDEIGMISDCRVWLLKKRLNKLNCGCVHPNLFTRNLQHIKEAHYHNTCLNRKISIDANGEIKNCPSMAKSYGNIRDTKLIDVVNDPEFQKVWHIKKDEITKCKDCEFRHICTDCRAYIDNPEDMYSAPLKCGYNPYTCEWEEWSTNPLKEKAIAFYGMEELVKKKD